ncbi:hypothetical protein [Paenibacillus eucommiae]|uniref:Restriction endonuclease type IV Mrr domain-containing protein n=1 Tax=Paenibacillus eucommiae TaxID=1355755 RepID=A0ABS4IXA5_9BACL|nr:hypothetical protein [Paenibacillus eucommiae]MBP1991184.1 hypothetical protein [Paenibacillus eucommiae]
MIEITGNDIKELNDTDLRSLVGLLCEAELRSAGLPVAGVTWGGHQNASDGGLDVRVEITAALHNDSFIPRSGTGFQVKKPDMPRSEIISEMRPEGELRQVIKDLADTDGAYIIVSSQGSTSDLSLRNRKAAMQHAVSDYANSSRIKLDFYDRERVAGWVRTHPALVLWVREKIGRPIHGWKTYDNWANCPGGIEEEYITDAHVRLYNATNTNPEGISIVDGINELKNILIRPGSSVRLVGLSGVGKTRLIQALFDERICEKPLNRSQVFYSDSSDSPFPDPRNFAERLIALQNPIVLVIDNCPPDLHRRLTSICSAAGSLISLITIEYDVREDQPEETEVYHLEPASVELIEKVMLARFGHISQVSVRTIAEFSGGNARIAITLARTIERGEDISRLRDQELFERLFFQRNIPDSKLQKAAEVCSLVYSFDCRTGEDENTELTLLGSLLEMSVRELYENISELKRRDLVQQRSNWRAVLPHAVANRLAARALENIPNSDITKIFLSGGSERLLTSFSRRLGYLHNCAAAKEIVRDWLSDTGILRDIRNLDELGINLFRNIAPVDPALILFTIENVVNQKDDEYFFTRKNNHFRYFTRLLRSIAYDQELFERSTHLLCQFALSENSNENTDSIRSLLNSLFYIYLSGTHATPVQRLNLISRLIESESEVRVNLGVSLLSAALESWHFSSPYNFEFGAHARDFGYSPKNKEDIKEWYKLFLDYVVTVAVSENPASIKLMSLLAKKFRGLWTRAAMYDELETAVRTISAKVSWSEGWVTVKSTKRYDGKNMKLDIISRLDKLADLLEPINLLDQIKLYTLSGTRTTLDLVDTVDDENASDIYALVEEKTRSFGRKIRTQMNIFNELLPELLSNDGIRIFDFGQGLAEGNDDPRDIWDDILGQLLLIDESRRNYQLLRGFLNTLSKTNTTLSEALLDEAITNKVLSVAFPFIQTSVDITQKGVSRLMQSLELGDAPIWQYGNLAYGKTHETIDDIDICELLRKISSQSEGIDVAIDILQMRLHGKTKNDVSELIATLGQELLVHYTFSRKNALRKDYTLANIIDCCFDNEAGTENARIVLTKIAIALENYDISTTDYDQSLYSLASSNALVFMDVFLGKSDHLNYRIAQLFSEDIATQRNPILAIKDEVILRWCNVDPTTRYPVAVSVIVPYRNFGTGLQWTPLAMNLIDNSSDPILILNKLKSTFRPTSWSGSRSEILQTRLPLLLELQNHEDPIIRDWAIQEERIFVEEIRLEREWELKHERERNERFE